MKRKLLLIAIFLGIIVVGTNGVLKAYESQKKVSGVVTDTTGKALEKVEVLIKGTITGAYTDAEGKYVIYTSASGVLVFSKKGMKTQEITVGNQTEINVVMHKTKEKKK
ncbi:carboxypeptidase-like regulatory domain-containing protein [Sanguibacteroides sp. AM78-02pH3A]|uniref:carboxypeptidase-like regulatory domain-containing protein n=1 Tax=Sanguibacteroides sp. AM78-02pH3A TaxID=3002646 RepID=UPI0022E1DAC6|nr:carboxypeptidase-like regulatory domain-containing protein [Sanguibacteroides sp. AM78-02pH3A]